MNASIKLFQIFKKYGGKRFISAGTKAEYFDGEFLDDYQDSTFECYELDKPCPILFMESTRIYLICN